MIAAATALLAFALLFGSAMAAMSLRRAMPEQHLKDDSKDAIKAGLGIIGTIGGLVLGLLVASATGSYNAQRGYVIQISSELALLDRALSHYGPEANPARAEIRASAQHVLNSVWSEQPAEEVPGGAQGDAAFDRIEDLTPKTPLQASVKGIATNVVLDIAKTRYLIYEQLETTVSRPLLIMLVFWFCVTFAGLGIFAPRNPTTVVGLALCAVAIAGAIYLILEMYSPFSGLLRIPSTALEGVIAHMGP
ncbi:MAG TPA: hypothetical protein VKB39_00250 [Candidatus Baltobacteraceae bacterium]|nr:hypothetical protein [Candidatus Baltobacteraceae bacterium]